MSNTSNPVSSPFLQTVIQHFPNVPSYVVALSMVGGVVGTIIVLYMVHLFVIEKTKKKLKVNSCEKQDDNNWETEKLREEAVVVDHLYLYDEHCLGVPHHDKPGPSPSIFSRGAFLSDVFENVEDNSNNNISSIFSRGDLLMEVMENVDDASNFSIPDFSQIETNPCNISCVCGGEQVGTLEVFEDDLGTLQSNSVLQTSPRESIKMSLFLKSIQTPPPHCLSPRWDFAMGLDGDESYSVSWRTILSSEGDEVLKEGKLYDEIRRIRGAVSNKDDDPKTVEDIPYEIVNVGYKCNDEVARWCRQELMEIINVVVTEHNPRESADDSFRFSSSSQQNVYPEPPSKVPLSNLPFPFQDIASSYLGMSVFSNATSPTTWPISQTSPSILSTQIVPVQSSSNYPTLGPSCMIPSYRVEYADREDSHPEEFLADSNQEIGPVTLLSVLPTSSQDISTSYIDMSVFGHPSPNRSSHKERLTLSLTSDFTLPVLSSRIISSLPLTERAVSVSHLFLYKGDSMLPSTPLSGNSDKYTSVYDSRQARANLHPSKKRRLSFLVQDH